MIKLCAFSDEASSDFDGQIEALVRNEIQYTELRAVDGKGVAELREDEAIQYEKKFADHGISVWAVGSPLGKVDINVDFNKYLETVKHICNLANIFKTDKIRMFSFFNAYNERNQVIDKLSKMVEIAATYGVDMYHENEKDIYGDTAERVLDVLDNVKGIKSIYDPANYIQVGEPASKTLDLLHSRAHYFHIKDVIAKTGEMVPAGYGSGEIPKLIDMIEGGSVLTLEPHLHLFDSFASIDDSEIKSKFLYKTTNQAFDAAVTALKNVLAQRGYMKVSGGYQKQSFQVAK